ncbi:Hypothetical predicted protein [Pelobates cultripes]|uniref:Uncharacterized protein n=1 Tax=Pelobates cultripes TaxID=61616 RepID=A0AAD1SZA8_PELCU|nr:Hypothetical predicted protein [Pelobates cultripes]
MHYLLEESLLAACMNLGKSVILQCLQQEVLPPDGTTDVLSGACQALAEAILKSVQLRILEDGCVTQKEILSYACSELAKLIKTQCPRGPGEMCRMQGELEYALSEASIASKLAEVINTRELVECVCSQHEAGLRTVLLTACQWLVNDIKALFLSEEVWSNFFGDTHSVLAALYTHLRPLLNIMVYQVNIQSNKAWECTGPVGIVSPESPNRYKGELDKNVRKQNEVRYEKQFKQKCLNRKEKQILNYNDSCIAHSSSKTGFQTLIKDSETKKTFYKEKVKYTYQSQDYKMVINNRKTQTSYIIGLMNTEVEQACGSTVLKLWCALINTNVFACNDLYDEKACYLITFGRYPVGPLELLSSVNCNDSAFKADITLREISCPIWPKDKSVIKRWFPDPRSQAIEEIGDWGNQCLQIWAIGSKKIEKRYPKTISVRSVEMRNRYAKDDDSNRIMYPKKTTGCFCFFKHKQNDEISHST